MISNNKKAVIHIAKAQTGRTEEEYRAMLSRVGVASSKDLTPAKFETVMREFKKLGFKMKTKRSKLISSKQRLLGKIKALSAAMELSHKYADGIARKMFSVDLVVWCDADQLRKIVAALMYKKKRDEQKRDERRTSNIEHPTSNEGQGRKGV